MYIGKDVAYELNDNFRKHMFAEINSGGIVNLIADVSIIINMGIHESIQFKLSPVEFISIHLKALIE